MENFKKQDGITPKIKNLIKESATSLAKVNALMREKGEKRARVSKKPVLEASSIFPKKLKTKYEPSQNYSDFQNAKLNKYKKPVDKLLNDIYDKNIENGSNHIEGKRRKVISPTSISERKIPSVDSSTPETVIDFIPDNIKKTESTDEKKQLVEETLNGIREKMTNSEEEEKSAIHNDLNLINKKIQSSEGIINLNESSFKSDFGKKRYLELKSIEAGRPVSFNKNELELIATEMEKTLVGDRKIEAVTTNLPPLSISASQDNLKEKPETSSLFNRFKDFFRKKM